MLQSRLIYQFSLFKLPLLVNMFFASGFLFGGKYQLAKYMAVAQFNSEENKGKILKLPVLTVQYSVKVQQKIVDLINYNKSKSKKAE